jgi:DNA-3-methyladenine glycosylase II
MTMRSPRTTQRALFAFRPRAPLDALQTLARYGRWGHDPASPYREGTLHRVAKIGGRLVPFRLAVDGSVTRPRATIAFEGPDTPGVRAALRREAGLLLGEPWDLARFYDAAAADPVLAPLVHPTSALFGARPTLVPDAFEMLVGAISAQQVNLAFAFVTRVRLVRRYGTSVAFDGLTVYAFPMPAVLAAAPVAELRAMQFSQRKAEYIVGLAGELATGRLDLAALAGAPDEAVIQRLTAVRGLGRWTAEWFLARALGRPDVCPADDLGVRRAVETLCFKGRERDAAAVRRRARTWHPHRSLATHYLLAAHAGARLATSPAAARGA